MVNYQKSHVLTEIRDELGKIDGINEKIQEFSDLGVAYTIFNKEIPIAVCGAAVLWEGVADVWFLTTHHIDKCKFHFYREVIMGMEHIKELFNLHRIQCSVEFDNERSMKWLETMGFKREGLMIEYGPDRKDHYRYALKCHS